MRDPTRIAETEARRGRPGMLMNLALQDRQDARQLSRDDSAFQRSLQMFGLEQQARDEAFQRGESAQTARDELRFQQDLERDRIDREAGSITGMETLLAPDGSAYLPVARTAGGQMRPMGGAMPIKQAPTLEMIPLPGTNTVVPMYGGSRVPNTPAYEMRPGWSVKGGPQYQPVEGQPKPSKLPVIKTEKGTTSLDPKTGQKVTSPSRDYYYEADPQTGKPVKRYVDEQGTDSSASTQGQQPAWMNWLNNQTNAK